MKKNKIAGKRLKVARMLLYGDYNQESLPDIKNWEKYISSSDRNLRNYEKEGVPPKKLNDIATFFKLPKYYFEAPFITEVDFKIALEERSINPDCEIKHFSSDEHKELTLKDNDIKCLERTGFLPIHNIASDHHINDENYIHCNSDDNMAFIYHSQGCQLYNEKKYYEAIGKFTQAESFASYEALSDIYYDRGSTYFVSGNEKKAINDYFKYLDAEIKRLVPNLPPKKPYISIKSWYDNNQNIFLTPKLSSNCNNRCLFNYAYGCYEMVKIKDRKEKKDKKIEKSLSCFKDALSKCNDTYYLQFIHASLGYTHFLLKDYDQAVKYFSFALREKCVENLKINILIYRGISYKKLNQYKLFENDFETASRLAPTDSQIIRVKIYLESHVTMGI